MRGAGSAGAETAVRAGAATGRTWLTGETAEVRGKAVSMVARDMGLESLVMMFRIPVRRDSAGRRRCNGIERRVCRVVALQRGADAQERECGAPGERSPGHDVMRRRAAARRRVVRLATHSATHDGVAAGHHHAGIPKGLEGGQGTRV